MSVRAPRSDAASVTRTADRLSAVLSVGGAYSASRKEQRGSVAASIKADRPDVQVFNVGNSYKWSSLTSRQEWTSGNIPMQIHVFLKTSYEAKASDTGAVHRFFYIGPVENLYTDSRDGLTSRVSRLEIGGELKAPVRNPLPSEIKKRLAEALNQDPNVLDNKSAAIVSRINDFYKSSWRMSDRLNPLYVSERVDSTAGRQIFETNLSTSTAIFGPSIATEAQPTQHTVLFSTISPFDRSANRIPLFDYTDNLEGGKGVISCGSPKAYEQVLENVTWLNFMRNDDISQILLNTETGANSAGEDKTVEAKQNYLDALRPELPQSLVEWAAKQRPASKRPATMVPDESSSAQDSDLQVVGPSGGGGGAGPSRESVDLDDPQFNRFSPSQVVELSE